MRLSLIISSVVLVSLIGEGAQRSPAPGSRATATRLETLSWPSAEGLLKGDAVVVLPLGAAAVEHGPHLPLDTDQRLADHLARLALEDLDVVIAPVLSYHHYPGLDEYPGSTSLSLNTARDLTADVVRSLSRHGPRRFYVLNTSNFTLPALVETAKLVARDGLLLGFTDLRARLQPAIRSLQRQPFGNHADEIETSIMLHIDPSAVDMFRATREIGNESNPFMLTRRQAGRGTYSPSGVWGDATLATPEKGATLVGTLVRAIRNDIDDLRRAPLPVAAPGAVAAPAAPQPGMRAETGSGKPNECSGGDERLIRSLGPAFSLAWAVHDAKTLASLWNAEGDMVHPDGFIEGSAQRILENRTALFARPEYKGSRHGLYVGQIRCITADVAIADAKWDLRGVTNSNGVLLPTVEGLSTMVLKRRAGGWGIEAYRYNLKQTQNLTQPTLLNRPGFTDTIR